MYLVHINIHTISKILTAPVVCQVLWAQRPREQSWTKWHKSIRSTENSKMSSDNNTLSAKCSREGVRTVGHIAVLAEWPGRSQLRWHLPLGTVCLSGTNEYNNFYMCFPTFPSSFWDRVSLCKPGWPGNHFVEQAGFQVLGLKVCTSMPALNGHPFWSWLCAFSFS